MSERASRRSRAKRARDPSKHTDQQFPEANGEHGHAADQGFGSHQADPRKTRPARVIVRRSPHREVGHVNAPWLLDHSIEHESWLERNFIYVALACPVVVDVEHQPETIEFTLADGSVHRYTPDFRVSLADMTKVVAEIKPGQYVAQHAAVLAAAAANYQSQGEHFMVVTHKQIYHNSRSARAILLMRYGRLQFTPEQAQECKQLLEAQLAGSAHVQQLIDRGISQELVWHMVASHMLRTDAPLNISTAETVAINEPQENCLDYFQRWFSHPDR